MKHPIILLLILISITSCQNRNEDKITEFRTLCGERYVYWEDGYKYFESLSEDDQKQLASRMTNDDFAVIYFGDVKSGKIKDSPKW